MKKSLRKVLKYCADNKIELNFSPDGIGLWVASVSDLPINSKCIRVGEIEESVEAINVLRDAGFEGS